MRRYVAALFLALCLMTPNIPKAEGAAQPPRLRALLIACDDFVTMPDTAPSSYNNAVALRRALLRDARGYERIRVSLNEALDAAALRALAAQAFLGAREGDTSLFYLSTHGLRQPGSDDFFALMSDGETETLLSGQSIRDALAEVPGTKIVILDACFSGAAIRKGLDTPHATSPFAGKEMKVLASAGGEEPSFLWTDGLGQVRGGSYFAQALTAGLTPLGTAQADANADGQVTLTELHAHQRAFYGASSPQVYPEGDATVVFAYAPGIAQGAPPQLSGLTVEPRTLFSPGEDVEVSYTLHAPARIAYQLVYRREGEWRFTAPQSISEDGILPPGRRVARLRLQPRMTNLSGYVLLIVVSVVEDHAEPLSCVLLTVRTGEEAASPQLEGTASFRPGRGEEASFLLRHTGPVNITANVLDEGGALVARLMALSPSRPLHLMQEGTPIVWNGRLEGGEPAPPGRYRLRVTVYTGQARSDMYGAFFHLLP